MASRKNYLISWQQAKWVHNVLSLGKDLAQGKDTRICAEPLCLKIEQLLVGILASEISIALVKTSVATAS